MISCSKTNIYLKRVAMEIGIEKRVTFHMAATAMPAWLRSFRAFRWKR